MNYLEIPCSYQGGKQRLAKNIVDILIKDINNDTKFFDVCCGSGSISIELMNRGINASNIVMVDKSIWGLFWKSIAEHTFDLEIFEEEIDKLPSIDKIHDYLQNLSNQKVNHNLLV